MILDYIEDHISKTIFFFYVFHTYLSLHPNLTL